MKYEDENWIKIYTRDSAGWISLSWQARGVALELARKLPKATGELSLGRRGLEALAALLRAPWSEIEPWVRELIEDGRLEYDEAAQIIRDPQHADRQNAVASGKTRTADWRARDAARRAVTDGDAPNTPPPPEPSTVTRKKTPAERAKLAAVPSPPALHEKANGSVSGVTERDAGVTPRDQEKEKKEEKEERPPIGGLTRARTPEVTHTPTALAARCLEPDEPLTDRRRHDHEGQIGTHPPRDIGPEWASFVDHQIKISALFASEGAIDAAWRNWVRRENTFAGQRRTNAQIRGKADTRQPMRDPNPEWLQRAAAGKNDL